MEEDERRPPAMDRGWMLFGAALLGGVVLVFLVEIVSLVASFGDVSGGMERGALWTILFMIFATFLAVGVIGGGLFRAIRASGRQGPGGEPASGGEPVSGGEPASGDGQRRMRDVADGAEQTTGDEGG